MSDTATEQIPFTFGLDFKSAEGSSFVTELQDGDLLIEGWGANLDIDREDEAFLDGAFSRSLKSFLSGNAPLCYHHKFDTVIGKVVDAEMIPGKGVKVRAVVDFQNESSPLRWIYDGIKRGRINGLSVGGIFKRVQTKGGPRISDVDILEWSATPVPVGRGTTFAVIAGKALQSGEGDPVTNEEVPAELEIEKPLEAAGEVPVEVTDDDSERMGAAEQEKGDCEECKKRAEAEAAAKEGEAEAVEPVVEEVPEEEAEGEAPDAETIELMRTLERLNGVLENVADALDARSPAKKEKIEDGSVTAEDGKSVNEIRGAAGLDPIIDYQAIEDSVADTWETFLVNIENAGGKAASHSSGGHAGLERSFRKNWVENVGGFPKHNWIYRASKHLHADAGMPISQAIAVAVNAAKKLCSTGDLNFEGVQQANATSRAEACAAVAEWEAMRARAKSD